LEFGGYRTGFSVTGEIKRPNFGSHPFENLVGGAVHLDIEVESRRD
jgi:polyisoprenoid-binding protein YceI